MKKYKFILIIFFLLFFHSCSKEVTETKLIKKLNQKQEIFMNKIFLFIILFTLLVSCSKKEEFKESVIKEKSLDLQVLEAYQEEV